MSKLKLIFTILFLFTCFGIVSAQDNQDDDMPPPQDQQRRPNLLRELGLTQEQMSQIREINQSNRQNIKAAHEKVADTRMKLDQAIYAEKVDEATVQIRLREFQDAQAEVAKIRANTEFAIRKVLTPDQLLRFRELRQRFEQLRRDRRQNDQPLNRRNEMRNQRRNNLQKPKQKSIKLFLHFNKNLKLKIAGEIIHFLRLFLYLSFSQLHCNLLAIKIL